jgi:uncharacterized lipoprotein YmbA
MKRKRMILAHSVTRRCLALLLPLFVGGAFLTGCSFLPQAQVDPTRYYVLSTAAAPIAPEGAMKAPVIHLRAIEIASYIRGRPMIVRHGDNEIEFRDDARWGEALEQGIGRVLREELLARGFASEVQAVGLRPVGARTDYNLSVRVLTCEGEVGGNVNFRAVWELSTTDAAAAVVAHGDFHPTDLKWDGKSETTLAAQLSKAVSELAGDIGAGLQKVK